MGSIAGPGNDHMLHICWACVPQLLSPHTAATETHVPTACVLHQEKPKHHDEEELPLAATRDSPSVYSDEDPAQPEINL